MGVAELEMGRDNRRGKVLCLAKNFTDGQGKNSKRGL
jgi:hypothetical protein